MESNKPNDDDNPLASTSPLQQHVNINHSRADYSGILHNVNYGGADFVPFPYMTIPVTPPPWDNMNGAYPSFMHEVPESGGYPMADLTRLNTLQNPQFDPNSTDMRNNIPLATPSGIANPGWNIGGMHQLGNHDYMVNPDNMMNCFNDYGSFQNSPMNGKFMLPAKSSDNNSPLIHRNPHNLRGSSAPIFYHKQNSGDTLMDNNLKVNANQFGRIEKIDGSFLSLGTGGNTEGRSKPTFSSQEIASQLNSSHVQQTTRDFSSLGHNLNSGFSSFQGNDLRLESSMNNLGGWASCNNDVGTICGSNPWLSSNAFHNLQAQQVDMQRNISMSSNRNSGFASKRQDIYGDLDPHNGFTGNKSNELLSFGQFGLAPESAKATDQLQNSYMKPKNLSAESSMGSPFPGLTKWNHSGQLVSANDGCAAQVGGHLFPKRMGIQSNEATVAQASTATCGSFPKRLGFQVNDCDNPQAATENPFPNGMGVQSASKVGRSQNSGSIQFPRNVVGSPTPTGRPRGIAPSQFPIGFRGPSSTTGQLQNVVPSHSAKDLHLIPVSTTGQGTPVEYVKGPAPLATNKSIGRPSLKRGASRPPPAAPTARRSKPTLRPTPNPPTQQAPPPPVPVSTTAHIKWQVPEEVSEPIGEKCRLCKRDLSFTPEGPMYQPAAPPPVAVLPCGHTFHDHCLQLITPEDQSKDPPCIPCAIDEN